MERILSFSLEKTNKYQPKVRLNIVLKNRRIEFHHCLHLFIGLVYAPSSPVLQQGEFHLKQVFGGVHVLCFPVCAGEFLFFLWGISGDGDHFHDGSLLFLSDRSACFFLYEKHFEGQQSSE
jgi:hypothetical protein